MSFPKEKELVGYFQYFQGRKKKAASGLLGIFCLCVTWSTRWVNQKPNSLKILGMPLPKKAKISVARNAQLLLPLHMDRDGGSFTHSPFSAVKADIHRADIHSGCQRIKDLTSSPGEAFQCSLPENPPKPTRDLRYHSSTQVLSGLLNKPQIQLLPTEMSSYNLTENSFPSKTMTP